MAQMPDAHLALVTWCSGNQRTIVDLDGSWIHGWAARGGIHAVQVC